MMETKDPNNDGVFENNSLSPFNFMLLSFLAGRGLIDEQRRYITENKEKISIDDFNRLFDLAQIFRPNQEGIQDYAQWKTLLYIYLDDLIQKSKNNPQEEEVNPLTHLGRTIEQIFLVYDLIEIKTVIDRFCEVSTRKKNYIDNSIDQENNHDNLAKNQDNILHKLLDLLSTLSFTSPSSIETKLLELIQSESFDLYFTQHIKPYLQQGDTVKNHEESQEKTQAIIAILINIILEFVIVSYDILNFDNDMEGESNNRDQDNLEP